MPTLKVGYHEAPTAQVRIEGNSINSTVSGTVSVNNLPAGGFSVLSNSTPKQVSVTATSVVLLPVNYARVYAHICNNTATTVYLQYEANAELGKGIRLHPGAMLTLTMGKDLFLGRISAICSSSASIDVLESTA